MEGLALRPSTRSHEGCHCSANLCQSPGNVLDLRQLLTEDDPKDAFCGKQTIEVSGSRSTRLVFLAYRLSHRLRYFRQVCTSATCVETSTFSPALLASQILIMRTSPEINAIMDQVEGAGISIQMWRMWAEDRAALAQIAKDGIDRGETRREPGES